MSSEAVRSLVEQMSGVISRYVDPSLDLDLVSFEEINENIGYLQRIVADESSNDELDIVVGLISQIIPCLYVARGFATKDVPRDRDYYSSMGDAQNLFRQIRQLGNLPGFESLNPT